MQFDHEKLRVYQEAIRFITWVEDLLQRIERKVAVMDHLDRSSSSIALAIAEGNGKFTPRDRCHYFDIARASALEAASCLDILVARRRVTEAEVRPGKEILHGVVSMLVGLIKSNSPDRVYESPGEYITDSGADDS